MSRVKRIYGVLGLLSLLFVMAVANISLSQSCTEINGRTERHFYSALDNDFAYTAYLPPCYDTTSQSFPVIYLLHGSNEDDGQWGRLGLYDTLDAMIVAGEIPPVIAIMPFGDWLANQNTFEQDSWAYVMLNHLLPDAESQYRIDARPQTRAIGGISRGGFWAFHLAFSHPELFTAVGGHSAFFDANNASADYNPLDLALNRDGLNILRIALDRGVDDYAFVGIDLMASNLTERGVSHEYTVYPEGEHNNAYWSEHIPDYLRFYTQTWVQDESRMTFATVTPVPTPNRDIDEQDGVTLYLPSVVFPSLQSTLMEDDLQAIYAGEFDSRLVLSTSVNARLASLGVIFHPDTRVVEDESLYNTLWRDRTLYTLLPFDALTTRYRVLYIDDQHPLDRELRNYQFAFNTESPNYFPERLTRVLFSGVTALTRDTLRALDTNGIDWAIEDIAPYVNSANFFHTSNEVSFHPSCPQWVPEAVGAFCSRPEHFELFNALDLDIVELSGNHNNDYGYDAYRETLAWYRDNGIWTVGGGETVGEARAPLVLLHHGNDIAIVSCNWVGPYYAWANEDPNLAGGIRPGAAQCDSMWLEETLADLAQVHDVVIVTVQYQESDQYTPTASQQFDFRTLVDWGADMVIGTSSHYPQTYEFYSPNGQDEAVIHYGLGNLFFDQTWFAGVRFFMDQLFVYDGELLTIDVYTGITEGQGRPRPMDANERENFLFLMMVEQGGL